MSKPRLITAVSLALFLHWLAAGHVTVTVAGSAVSVPALMVAAAAVISASIAAALAVAWRIQADRILLTTWQAPADGDTASVRPAQPSGGAS